MYEKKEKLSIYSILSGIICLALGVGTAVLAVFWSARRPSSWLLIMIALGLIFVSLSICTFIALKAIERKRRVGGPSGPVLGSIMYDMVNTASEPALICDENKRIIWFNHFAQRASGISTSLLGGLDKLYSRLYKAFMPAVLRATGIGTWANYWCSVYSEDFSNAVDLVFGEEGSELRTEYAGLIAKLDNYEFPPADIDIIKYLKEKN